MRRFYQLAIPTMPTKYANCQRKFGCSWLVKFIRETTGGCFFSCLQAARLLNIEAALITREKKTKVCSWWSEWSAACSLCAFEVNELGFRVPSNFLPGKLVFFSINQAQVAKSIQKRIPSHLSPAGCARPGTT